MSGTIYEFSDLPRRASGAGAGGKRRKAVRDVAAQPNVGIVYNPRSHRNKGQDLALGGLDNVMLATPEKRGQIAATLERFAAADIDYLIINGGDGTVRDVLTCGADVFGEDWPDLAVLPKGKTNALNVDLGAPNDWSLVDAIRAYHAGRRVTRRPLELSQTGSDSAPVRGFILGAGIFTRAIEAGQDAHRLGFFDSLAVGSTALWALLQALFGRDSNPWRTGVEMDIRLLPGRAQLERSEYGDPTRRAVLFASTLKTFPVGLKPFGTLRDGLRMIVLDHPRRRILARLPSILRGGPDPKWLEGSGVHRRAAEGFSLTIGDQFILDGEAFPAGDYIVGQGPELTFVTA